MKKLLFVFVAIAAMTIASCGGKVTPASISNDSDSIVVVDSIDSVAIDTLSVDTVAD
jgi:hypothetical protein